MTLLRMMTFWLSLPDVRQKLARTDPVFRQRVRAGCSTRQQNAGPPWGEKSGCCGSFVMVLPESGYLAPLLM
jgi:hypothetical protein